MAKDQPPTIDPIITQPEPDPNLPFAELYAHTYGDQTRAQWQQAWDQCIEHWLNSGNRRSAQTRAIYRRNVNLFLRHIADHHGTEHLWQANATHVRVWVHQMNQAKLSNATINQRLATLSSLYSYASNTVTNVHGRELSLFIDPYGNQRPNPFTEGAIQRPKVTAYGNANALPAEIYTWIIQDYQQQPLNVSNLRSFALLLMFGLSGWRVSEILEMQTQNIQKGEKNYTYVTTNNSDRPVKHTLPTNNHDAIVAYLTAANRTIHQQEYIWQPIANVKRNNFTDAQKDRSTNRPIHRNSATGILRRSLRRYYKIQFRQQGLNKEAAQNAAHIQAQKYTLNSLRHMAAQQLYSGSNNIQRVQQLLNHKQIATTQRCLNNIAADVETNDQILARQLALTFPKNG